MNDTTRDEPMAGLAEWLLFTSRNMTKDPRDREQLRVWASEVESRRAACSSLPDGPVGDERAAFEVRFPHFDLTKTRDAWDRPQYASQHVESIWFGWQARASLSAVSLPDGGAAERADTAKALRELLDVIDAEPRPFAPSRRAWFDRLEKAQAAARAALAGAPAVQEGEAKHG